MAKAYWVVCYRSISDPTARENYSKLGAPAVLAAGGRFLTRGIPAKTYEHGIKERTVVIEFDNLAQAIAAHSPLWAMGSATCESSKASTAERCRARSAPKLLSKDEARRIANNIAKRLPGCLSK